MKSGDQATSHADQRIPFWPAIVFIGRFHPSLFAGPLEQAVSATAESVSRAHRATSQTGRGCRLDRALAFPDDLPAPSGTVDKGGPHSGEDLGHRQSPRDFED